MARIFKNWFMSAQTEIFIYGMAGITCAAMEQSLLDENEYLREVQNAPLPPGYFGPMAEHRIKTILSNAVLARSHTVHAYLFSYLAVILVSLFGQGRFWLIPWLMLSAFRHFVIDTTVALTGVYICLKYQITPVCLEYIMMRFLRISMAAYMWNSVVLLFGELMPERLMKPRPSSFAISREATQLLDRALQRCNLRPAPEFEAVPSATAAGSSTGAAMAVDEEDHRSCVWGQPLRRRTSEGITGARDTASARAVDTDEGSSPAAAVVKLAFTRSLESLLSVLDYNAEALAPLLVRRREERRAGDGATPRQRALCFLRLTERDVVAARQRAMRSLDGSCAAAALRASHRPGPGSGPGPSSGSSGAGAGTGAGTSGSSPPDAPSGSGPGGAPVTGAPDDSASTSSAQPRSRSTTGSESQEVSEPTTEPHRPHSRSSGATQDDVDDKRWEVRTDVSSRLTDESSPTLESSSENSLTQDMFRPQPDLFCIPDIQAAAPYAATTVGYSALSASPPDLFLSPQPPKDGSNFYYSPGEHVCRPETGVDISLEIAIENAVEKAVERVVGDAFENAFNEVPGKECNLRQNLDFAQLSNGMPDSSVLHRYASRYPLENSSCISSSGIYNLESVEERTENESSQSEEEKTKSEIRRTLSPRPESPRTPEIIHIRQNVPWDGQKIGLTSMPRLTWRSGDRTPSPKLSESPIPVTVLEPWEAPQPTPHDAITPITSPPPPPPPPSLAPKSVGRKRSSSSDRLRPREGRGHSPPPVSRGDKTPSPPESAGRGGSTMRHPVHQQQPPDVVSSSWAADPHQSGVFSSDSSDRGVVVEDHSSGATQDHSTSSCDTSMSKKISKSPPDHLQLRHRGNLSRTQPPSRVAESKELSKQARRSITGFCNRGQSVQSVSEQLHIGDDARKASVQRLRSSRTEVSDQGGRYSPTDDFRAENNTAYKENIVPAKGTLSSRIPLNIRRRNDLNTDSSTGDSRRQSLVRAIAESATRSTKDIAFSRISSTSKPNFSNKLPAKTGSRSPMRYAADSTPKSFASRESPSRQSSLIVKPIGSDRKALSSRSPSINKMTPTKLPAGVPAGTKIKSSHRVTITPPNDGSVSSITERISPTQDPSTKTSQVNTLRAETSILLGREEGSVEKKPAKSQSSSMFTEDKQLLSAVVGKRVRPLGEEKNKCVKCGMIGGQLPDEAKRTPEMKSNAVGGIVHSSISTSPRRALSNTAKTICPWRSKARITSTQLSSVVKTSSLSSDPGNKSDVILQSHSACDKSFQLEEGKKESKTAISKRSDIQSVSKGITSKAQSSTSFQDRSHSGKSRSKQASVSTDESELETSEKLKGSPVKRRDHQAKKSRSTIQNLEEKRTRKATHDTSVPEQKQKRERVLPHNRLNRSPSRKSEQSLKSLPATIPVAERNRRLNLETTITPDANFSKEVNTRKVVSALPRRMLAHKKSSQEKSAASTLPGTGKKPLRVVQNTSEQFDPKSTQKTVGKMPSTSEEVGEDQIEMTEKGEKSGHLSPDLPFHEKSGQSGGESREGHVADNECSSESASPLSSSRKLREKRGENIDFARRHKRKALNRQFLNDAYESIKSTEEGSNVRTSVEMQDRLESLIMRDTKVLVGDRAMPHHGGTLSETCEVCEFIQPFEITSAKGTAGIGNASAGDVPVSDDIDRDIHIPLLEDSVSFSPVPTPESALSNGRETSPARKERNECRPGAYEWRTKPTYVPTKEEKQTDGKAEKNVDDVHKNTKQTPIIVSTPITSPDNQQAYSFQISISIGGSQSTASASTESGQSTASPCSGQSTVNDSAATSTEQSVYDMSNTIVSEVERSKLPKPYEESSRDSPKLNKMNEIYGTDDNVSMDRGERIDLNKSNAHSNKNVEAITMCHRSNQLQGRSDGIILEEVEETVSDLQHIIPPVPSVPISSECLVRTPSPLAPPTEFASPKASDCNTKEARDHEYAISRDITIEGKTGQVLREKTFTSPQFCLASVEDTGAKYSSLTFDNITLETKEIDAASVDNQAEYEDVMEKNLSTITSGLTQNASDKIRSCGMSREITFLSSSGRSTGKAKNLQDMREVEKSPLNTSEMLCASSASYGTDTFLSLESNALLNEDKSDNEKESNVNEVASEIRRVLERGLKKLDAQKTNLPPSEQHIPCPCKVRNDIDPVQLYETDMNDPVQLLTKHSSQSIKCVTQDGVLGSPRYPYCNEADNAVQSALKNKAELSALAEVSKPIMNQEKFPSQMSDQQSASDDSVLGPHRYPYCHEAAIVAQTALIKEAELSTVTEVSKPVVNQGKSMSDQQSASNDSVLGQHPDCHEAAIVAQTALIKEAELSTVTEVSKPVVNQGKSMSDQQSASDDSVLGPHRYPYCHEAAIAAQTALIKEAELTTVTGVSKPVVDQGKSMSDQQSASDDSVLGPHRYPYCHEAAIAAQTALMNEAELSTVTEVSKPVVNQGKSISDQQSASDDSVLAPHRYPYCHEAAIAAQTALIKEAELSTVTEVSKQGKSMSDQQSASDDSIVGPHRYPYCHEAAIAAQTALMNEASCFPITEVCNPEMKLAGHLPKMSDSASASQDSILGPHRFPYCHEAAVAAQTALHAEATSLPASEASKLAIKQNETYSQSALEEGLLEPRMVYHQEENIEEQTAVELDAHSSTVKTVCEISQRKVNIAASMAEGETALTGTVTALTDVLSVSKVESKPHCTTCGSHVSVSLTVSKREITSLSEILTDSKSSSMESDTDGELNVRDSSSYTIGSEYFDVTNNATLLLKCQSDVMSTALPCNSGWNILSTSSGSVNPVAPRNNTHKTECTISSNEIPKDNIVSSRITCCYLNSTLEDQLNAECKEHVRRLECQPTSEISARRPSKDSRLVYSLKDSTERKRSRTKNQESPSNIMRDLSLLSETGDTRSQILVQTGATEEMINTNLPPQYDTMQSSGHHDSLHLQPNLKNYSNECTADSPLTNNRNLLSEFTSIIRPKSCEEQRNLLKSGCIHRPKSLEMGSRDIPSQNKSRSQSPQMSVHQGRSNRPMSPISGVCQMHSQKSVFSARSPIRPKSSTSPVLSATRIVTSLSDDDKLSVDGILSTDSEDGSLLLLSNKNSSETSYETVIGEMLKTIEETDETLADTSFIKKVMATSQVKVFDKIKTDSVYIGNDDSSVIEENILSEANIANVELEKGVVLCLDNAMHLPSKNIQECFDCFGKIRDDFADENQQWFPSTCPLKESTLSDAIPQIFCSVSGVGMSPECLEPRTKSIAEVKVSPGKTSLLPSDTVSKNNVLSPVDTGSSEQNAPTGEISILPCAVPTSESIAQKVINIDVSESNVAESVQNADHSHNKTTPSEVILVENNEVDLAEDTDVDLSMKSDERPTDALFGEDFSSEYTRQGEDGSACSPAAYQTIYVEDVPTFGVIRCPELKSPPIDTTNDCGQRCIQMSPTEVTQDVNLLPHNQETVPKHTESMGVQIAAFCQKDVRASRGKIPLSEASSASTKGILSYQGSNEEDITCTANTISCSLGEPSRTDGDMLNQNSEATEMIISQGSSVIDRGHSNVSDSMSESYDISITRTTEVRSVSGSRGVVSPTTESSGADSRYDGSISVSVTSTSRSTFSERNTLKENKGSSEENEIAKTRETCIESSLQDMESQKRKEDISVSENIPHVSEEEEGEKSSDFTIYRKAYPSYENPSCKGSSMESNYESDVSPYSPSPYAQDSIAVCRVDNVTTEIIKVDLSFTEKNQSDSRELNHPVSDTLSDVGQKDVDECVDAKAKIEDLSGQHSTDLPIDGSSRTPRSVSQDRKSLAEVLEKNLRELILPTVGGLTPASGATPFGSKTVTRSATPTRAATPVSSGMCLNSDVSNSCGMKTGRSRPSFFDVISRENLRPLPDPLQDVGSLITSSDEEAVAEEPPPRKCTRPSTPSSPVPSTSPPPRIDTWPPQAATASSRAMVMSPSIHPQAKFPWSQQFSRHSLLSSEGQSPKNTPSSSKMVTRTPSAAEKMTIEEPSSQSVQSEPAVAVGPAPSSSDPAKPSSAPSPKSASTLVAALPPGNVGPRLNAQRLLPWAFGPPSQASPSWSAAVRNPTLMDSHAAQIISSRFSQQGVSAGILNPRLAAFSPPFSRWAAARYAMLPSTAGWWDSPRRVGGASDAIAPHQTPSASGTDAEAKAGSRSKTPSPRRSRSKHKKDKSPNRESGGRSM